MSVLHLLIHYDHICQQLAFVCIIVDILLDTDCFRYRVNNISKSQYLQKTSVVSDENKHFVTIETIDFLFAVLSGYIYWQFVSTFENYNSCFFPLYIICIRKLYWRQITAHCFKCIIFAVNYTLFT